MRLHLLWLGIAVSATLSADPTDAALYEKWKSQEQLLGRQIANQADLISYATVEEATLAQIGEDLQRIRELLLRRASGLTASSDRAILDDEIAGWASDVFETLKGAQFNTVRIFGPWIDDPQVGLAIRDPAHYTLEGIDALLEFVNAQRARDGAWMNTLALSIEGGAVAQQNTGDARDASEVRQSQLSLLSGLIQQRR